MHNRTAMSAFSLLLAALISLAPGELATRLFGDAGGLIVPLDPPVGAEVPPPIVAGEAGRPLVVIDAGHGGHDPGARSPFDGTAEKSVTLALARAARDAILETGRARVALTRDDDRFLDLRDRYAVAQRLGAALFISIHADAAPSNDQARGATVYTLSEVASDREAALLAARENRAGTGAGLAAGDRGVDRILIDLAQRESMERSAEFARLLKREAEAGVPFRANFHRFASLIVLKAPDVPSVLFESGYLTNAADAAFIQSDDGRRAIASGIAGAVEAHIARRVLQTIS